MWTKLIQYYLNYEQILLEWISSIDQLKNYTKEPVSARITLFLMIMGTFAFFNELYITIEMSFLQKETYQELNNNKLDQSLKGHRMIWDDSYHGREWFDEKSGIVIEEFESKEKFFSKPVHVAHIYVKCNVQNEGKTNYLVKPMKFHVEFSPEDFEYEKRPEFGCNLSVLRTKLYYFFKETLIYQEITSKRPDLKFTISQNVQIYNKMDELLTTEFDSIQLCFLKMETGDIIECNFVI